LSLSLQAVVVLWFHNPLNTLQISSVAIFPAKDDCSKPHGWY